MALPIRGILLLAALSLVLAGCTSPQPLIVEEPAPQKQISLSSEWSFQTDPDDIGEVLAWYEPGELFDETIMVPANWEDQGYDGYDGVAWYKRVVDLPIMLPGDKWALLFEGVDDDAKVWLNDELVAENTGYNRRFHVELHERDLPPEVTVTVRVMDHGIGGGIWRPVSLVRYKTEDDLLRSELFDVQLEGMSARVQDEVLYEVFVRDFSEEGTFDEVTARLDEIRDLGVTTVWLMPIFPLGEKLKKGPVGSPYSVRDYRGINPRFGTEEDLRELVQGCHDRGMKLILDWVANHSAPDNPLVDQHPDWYTRNEQGEIVPPVPDWHDVYDFNYESQELRKYMKESMAYWLREFDVDGFRCDVAGMVPASFWEWTIDDLREIEPNLLMLAEADGPAFYFQGFNMTYDNVLHGIMTRVAHGEEPPAALLEHVRSTFYSYPENATIMRYVENHDQQRAFNPDIMGMTAKPLWAFVCTVPGAPLIYNGQEVGAEKRLDLFVKDHVEWDEGDPEIREWHKQLLAIRAAEPGLRTGATFPVETNRPDAVLAYRREGVGQEFLVVMNLFGEKVEGLELTKSGGFTGTDLLTGAADISAESISSLAPYEVVILKP